MHDAESDISDSIPPSDVGDPYDFDQAILDEIDKVEVGGNLRVEVDNVESESID